MAPCSGDKDAGASAFRCALRRLASTVAVVTAGEAEQAIGMTATAITSLSFAPPSLLICVNRSARLHGVLSLSRAFRVTWLHSGQAHIAKAFATSGLSASERFQAGGWRPAAKGRRLVQPMAEAGCILDHAFNFGTHTVFVGVVEDVVTGGGDPLLYSDGMYLASARSAA